MSEKYFVVQTDENGAYLEVMTKKELLKRIRGDMKPHDLSSGSTDLCAASGFTIIKGEIVIPKPVQTVTEWEL